VNYIRKEVKKMKKLGKRQMVKRGTLQAYGCAEKCGCRCSIERTFTTDYTAANLPCKVVCQIVGKEYGPYYILFERYKGLYFS